MEYGAIDLHTKHSEIRIVTADGTVVFERRISTRADQFASVFGGRARMRILLEASTESEWVATCLEELGRAGVLRLTGHIEEAYLGRQVANPRCGWGGGEGVRYRALC
jgi:hypothetical protein